MENISNGSDGSDGRGSSQNEPLWSRRSLQQHPAPSSVHDFGTSLDRTSLDQHSSQPAQEHQNNNRGRAWPPREVNLRSSDEELERGRLFSLPKNPLQQRRQYDTDCRRLSPSLPCSTKLEPATIPPQQGLNPSGERKIKKSTLSPTLSRRNAHAQRSAENVEDLCPPGRTQGHPPSSEARTVLDERYVDIRAVRGELGARLRNPQPQEASPDQDRRHSSRDPRLARKAEVQARKFDGSLSRRERRLSPDDGQPTPRIKAKSQQLLPAAKSDGQLEEPRLSSTGKRRPGSPSGYAPCGDDSLGDRVGLAQAPSHFVESQRAPGAGLEGREGRASDSQGAPSESVPIDPRRQREPRSSPLVCTAKHSSSNTVNSTTPIGSFRNDESKIFSRAGIEASGGRAPSIPSSDIEPVETLSPREDVCAEHRGGVGGSRLFAKDGSTFPKRGEEIKLGSVRFARRPPHFQEQKCIVRSEMRGEANTIGTDHGRDETNRDRLADERGTRLEDDEKGTRRHLALSIQGVTLGGTVGRPRCSPPRSEAMRGVHVRLPLQGQPDPSKSSSHVLPLKGHPPFPLHRGPMPFHSEPPQFRPDPQPYQPERPSFYREPPPIHREPPPIKHELPPFHRNPPPFQHEAPPPHNELRPPLHREPPPSRNTQHLGGPPGVQNIPPKFGPINPLSRTPPKQRPRPDNRPLAEPIRARGMSDGYNCDGKFRHQPPQIDHLRPRVTSPPSAAGPRFADDGERRSAYAQAMHNKRFMRPAPEGIEPIRSAQPEGGRGPRMPASGIDIAATSLGPPNPQMRPPMQFPQRDYIPESRFHGPPPAGQWDNGSRGNLANSHGGFDRGEPIGRHPGQLWDTFDDDDAEFPLEHTSPEWTPASARGRSKRPEPDVTSMNMSSGHGRDDGGVSVTTAELAKCQSVEGKGESNGEIATEVTKKESSEAPLENSYSIAPRERVDESLDDIPRTAPEIVTACSTSADVSNGTQLTGGSDATGISRKETVHKQQKLEPTPLAQVSWGVGDLTRRFPWLTIPESLTHVVASWAALDTRTIGVIPMLCQPLLTRPVEENKSARIEEERRTAKGKGKRKRIDDRGGAMEVEQAAGDASGGRTWDSRVLVPFGVIPERAAEGCWAEAFRLVLAAANTGDVSPPDDDDDGDGNISSDGGDDEALSEKGRASNAMPLTLPGGLWDQKVDGGDPEKDDNCALITTAVRASATSGGVDLSGCSSWLKFCELHDDDRVTVVFLCGGGVRPAEGAAPEDLSVATLSDLIKDAGVSSLGGVDGVVEIQGAAGATFETRLAAEFLWGLVSRDWAAVMLDCLRLHARALDAAAEKPIAPAGEEATATGNDSMGVRRKLPQVDRQEHEMIETPAEVRAAFGLFDEEGKGCVSGDRIEAWLFDAGFRLSARYVKSLVRSLCRVTEDGKRLLFEYRRRLATWGTEGLEAGSVGMVGSAQPPPSGSESTASNKAMENAAVAASTAAAATATTAASGSEPTAGESVHTAGNPGRETEKPQDAPVTMSAS